MNRIPAGYQETGKILGDLLQEGGVAGKIFLDDMVDGTPKPFELKSLSSPYRGDHGTRIELTVQYLDNNTMKTLDCLHCHYHDIELVKEKPST